MDQEELVRMSESLKSAHKRINSLEAKVEDIHALTAAVAAVNTKVEDLGGSLEEIKAEVKKSAERPALWWDRLLAALLGAIASGVAAAILSGLLTGQ